MNQLKRAIMWKKENYEENDYLLTTPHQMRKVTVQKKKYLRNIVKSNFGSYNSNQNTHTCISTIYLQYQEIETFPWPSFSVWHRIAN